MKESSVDIWCLEGVYNGVYNADIQQRIYRELRQTYPYTYSILDLNADFDTQRPACTPSEIRLLNTCVQTQCGFEVSVFCIAARYRSMMVASGNNNRDTGQFSTIAMSKQILFWLDIF